mgnify:FL=1|jgi:uncharacterized membrane protein YdjX (TVP38/TMEM64 family)
MNLQRALPRLILLAGIVAAIIWVGRNFEQLDSKVLDEWLAGFGIWAPLAFIGLYTVAAVIFMPGSLFALAAGALFGPIWGSLLSLLGATMGASMAFLIARYFAGDWVAHKTGGRIRKFIEGVEAENWRFVAFVRLVPLFPFNLTNYALGLTRIKLVPYVVTSFFCMAPGGMAYTWLGHAGREVFDGNFSAIQWGLLALALLAAIAFLPRLVRRLKASSATQITA